VARDRITLGSDVLVRGRPAFQICSANAIKHPELNRFVFIQMNKPGQRLRHEHRELPAVTLFLFASTHRTVKWTGVRAPLILMALVQFVVALPYSIRADDEVGSEYRATLSPHYPIKGDFSGFAHLEYRMNPEKDYQVYDILWPGLAYSVNHWLQFSGGLITRYSDHEQGADTLELRPFAGVKFSIPNEIKWHIYNYTRYEFRDIQNRETSDWTGTHRVRSRFGVEVPLTSRGKAWKPKTWYGLTDVEPIYRFDRDTIDPLRVRAGIGHVLNERLRIEFIYYAQFTRPNEGGLRHTENIFRLNFKIGLAKGVLERLENFASDD